MRGNAVRKGRNEQTPLFLQRFGKNVIMDSGLFTLMFGADQGKHDEAFLHRWMMELVAFVKEMKFKGTCVEVDCQKLLSPEIAWKFRREMKELLPDNRIINVYHLEDGKEGLDKLIEFSDYIAISVPELRIHKSGTYKQDVYNLSRYIKSKKRSIDIHLLGCTESDMLKDNRFCTSADSTSWSAIIRWPKLPFTINGKRIVKDNGNLNEEKLIGHYHETVEYVMGKHGIRNTDKSKGYIARICFAGEMFLHEYEHLLGNQK